MGMGQHALGRGAGRGDEIGGIHNKDDGPGCLRFGGKLAGMSPVRRLDKHLSFLPRFPAGAKLKGGPLTGRKRASRLRSRGCPGTSTRWTFCTLPS